MKKLLALLLCCLALALPAACSEKEADREAFAPPAGSLASGDGWWVGADYQYTNAFYGFSAQLPQGEGWTLPSQGEIDAIEEQLKTLIQSNRDQYEVLLYTVEDDISSVPKASITCVVEAKDMLRMSPKTWTEKNRENIIIGLVDEKNYSMEESKIQTLELGGGKAYGWDIMIYDFDTGAGGVKEMYWMGFVRMELGKKYLTLEMNADSPEGVEACQAFAKSFALAK